MALLLAALVTGACGGGDRATPEVRVFEGQLADLRFGSDGPDDLRSFVIVEDATGDRVVMKIDRQHDYGFELGHLREHDELEQPVTVEAEKRSDGWYALSIDDA